MPVNCPQRNKIANFDSMEDACTGEQDSDGELGPFFDENDQEGEQDFDKDSRPICRPVLVEKYKDEFTKYTPEDKTPCHVPIEDAVLSKMKVAELS